MQRSSESIAALAAALAKAQCEISNPEKSLAATIGGDRPGEGAHSFRYAPLSSGFDIIRKSLGHQQIATMQTTAIDASAGTVNLTTVLAHASGEWIASDWPVCRLADTATPHRMGAALTYARRYALFTLVGIAGEDDLDAPDLNGAAQQRTVAGAGKGSSGSPEPPRAHLAWGNAKGVRPAILDAAASVALRDRLVREVARLDSTEAAAEWARAALPAKNTLTGSDARLVQVAFELRLSALEPGAAAREDELQRSLPPVETGMVSKQPRGSVAATKLPRPSGKSVRQESAKAGSSGRIDKSVLHLSEARRFRDKAHIKFEASQPCLVCGRALRPAPSALRPGQGVRGKVSDEFTVPLCRLHHRELHRARNEAGWWSKLGIDALAVALRLWKKTRLAEAAPTASPAPSMVQTPASGSVIHDNLG
jgi:hypothetical protein